MNISFETKRLPTPPELLFCWRLTIDVAEEAAIPDLFIPELYYDYFFLRSGRVSCGDRELPRQTLKTLHTHALDLTLHAPLDMFGARFSLSFAEQYSLENMSANGFAMSSWLDAPVGDLDTFAHRLSRAARVRRRPEPVAPMFRSSLEESDRLAAYSPRHKRRLYASVLGIRPQEFRAIRNVHRFLAQACDMSDGMPHIGTYVNFDDFYDQPHLNRTFKKVTGRSPLAYFEANSILQENLMAASYKDGAGAAG